MKDIPLLRETIPAGTFYVFIDPTPSKVRWQKIYTEDNINWETVSENGFFSGDEWLECIGIAYENPNMQTTRYVRGTTVLKEVISEDASPTEMARYILEVCPKRDSPHLFLDSFSIIENGEESKRKDREIRTSSCQKALLDLVAGSSREIIKKMSPREFEVLVARTLSEIGFNKVELRRYSKDGGVDILAVLADGINEELVVVEVKHSKNNIGLATLDRLNGVRDRMNADRGLLIVSSQITKPAIMAYEAKNSYINGYAYNELISILKDANDWARTPHGLWTKKA